MNLDLLETTKSVWTFTSKYRLIRPVLLCKMIENDRPCSLITISTFLKSMEKHASKIVDSQKYKDLYSIAPYDDPLY